MLRCGHCDVICSSYEDWLSHLVSEQHQTNLGVSDVLTKYGDEDRDERSLIMIGMNPKTPPYEVVCHFAQTQSLGFVTDVYIHIFPTVKENFYLIVFDQKKFVDRIISLHEKYGDQKVITSMVQCKRKTSLSELSWKSKLDTSFFYRRHRFLMTQFPDMNWDHQLTKLLPMISLCSKGYQLREKVMEELESLLHAESEDFENATMNAFGSCMTWLADANADLDVYLDATGEGGRADLDPDKRFEIMSQVQKIFGEKYGVINVYTIRNAKVPIIILQHPSGLKVDVSFDNCLSVQNSKMIRLMSKLDYRVRPFLIFLRYWARYHNLIGSHSIKSYALILMAFVYLRSKKIIPSVCELQNLEGVRTFMVCNWNASYCSNRDAVKQQLPWLKCFRDPSSTDGMGHEIMKLCYGFFSDYASFDFENMVICPFIGESLAKRKFESENGVELPEQMGLLKANLVTSQCLPFQTYRPLCIQDPYALNVNVTASCNDIDIVYQFKAACSQAMEALRPYIKTYGLADKELILEICCQPISPEKKMEIMRGPVVPESITPSESESENYDYLAYVKTEATTTTNDEGFHVPPEDDNNNDNERPSNVEDALASIRNFYRGQFDHDIAKEGSPSSSSKNPRDPPSPDQEDAGSNNSNGSGGGSYRNSLCSDRDRERTRPSASNPERILRTSIYDQDVPNSASAPTPTLSKGLVNYDYECDTEESPLSKDMAQQDLTSNSKGISSTISSSSFSSSIMMTTTPTNSEKSDRRLSSSLTSPAMKKKRTSSQEGSGPGTVELVKIKIESGILSGETESGTYSNAANCKELSPEEKRSLENLKQEKEEEKELEEFYKMLKTENAQKSVTQAADKNDAPRADSDSLGNVPPMAKPADFNYGYRTVSMPLKRSANSTPCPQLPAPPPVNFNFVTVTAETENQDQSSSKLGSKITPLFPDLPPSSLQPGSRFPACSLFPESMFQRHFLWFYKPLLTMVPEDDMRPKMFQLWVMTATDFFLGQNFWGKLDPVISDMNTYKISGDDLRLVFHQVQANLESFRSQGTKYCQIVSMEEMQEPPPRIIRHQSLIPQSYHGTVDYDMQFSTKAKYEKLPPKRKRYAAVYSFSCYHDQMLRLYNRWLQMSDKVLDHVTANKGPLEIFGGLCMDLKLRDLPQSPEPVQIKMLVALETETEVPGVFIGFQNENLAFDPTNEKQASVHHVIKALIENLLPKTALYRLHRHFK